MSRPNLDNLTVGNRRLLASLIQQYATPEIIDIHWNAAQSGAHSNPVMFLNFHREYIGGLEVFLLGRGFPGAAPLPAWNPAGPIPGEFNIPNIGPRRLRNLNPAVSFSPEFDPENLSSFRTVAELGEALMTRHNLVHQRIGGIMNDMRLAPLAPIFWPFHSLIDDIYDNWQTIQ